MAPTMAWLSMSAAVDFEFWATAATISRHRWRTIDASAPAGTGASALGVAGSPASAAAGAAALGLSGAGPPGPPTPPVPAPAGTGPFASAEPGAPTGSPAAAGSAAGRRSPSEPAAHAGEILRPATAGLPPRGACRVCRCAAAGRTGGAERAAWLSGSPA